MSQFSQEFYSTVLCFYSLLTYNVSLGGRGTIQIHTITRLGVSTQYSAALHMVVVKVLDVCKQNVCDVSLFLATGCVPSGFSVLYNASFFSVTSFLPGILHFCMTSSLTSLCFPFQAFSPLLAASYYSSPVLPIQPGTSSHHPLPLQAHQAWMPSCCHRVPIHRLLTKKSCVTIELPRDTEGSLAAEASGKCSF